MKPRAFPLWLLLAALSIGTTIAQDWAKERLNKSPRHSEWVDLKHGDRTVKTFVVYPEVKTKAPAVLVIHEIFGLTDWARNLADELAAAASLLMGQAGEGHPVVLVRGFPYPLRASSAAELLRPIALDLFR